MTDAIKEKIKKLLAMGAKGSGATEDEAETAMRLAAGLMMRHGIEQSDLAGAAKPKATRGKRVNMTLKRYQTWTAQAAGVLYGCEVIVYDGGKAGFDYVGRPDNIDASEQTVMWLFRQVEEFYKQALRPGMTQAERAEFRRTFKEACALRVLKRARDLIANAAALATGSGSTALVVAGYFEGLKAENQLVLAAERVKIKRVAPVRWGSGSSAGSAAGDRVQLRREIR